MGSTRVGRGVEDIAASSNAVWAANPSAGTLYRLDPKTGKPTQQVRVPVARNAALTADGAQVAYVDLDRGVGRLIAASGHVHVLASPGTGASGAALTPTSCGSPIPPGTRWPSSRSDKEAAMNRIVLSLCLCAALLLAAGCGSDRSTDSSAHGGSGAEAAKSDPGEAVVFVRASYNNHNTAGTGFIYDAQQGLILTSDHAVEAAKAITVTDRHGEVMHGQVLARAQCHDFAVVKLHPIPTDLHALTFADSSSVRGGASVTSVSYSLNNSETGTPTLTTTRGTVSAIDVAAKLHHLLPTISPLIAHQVPLNAQGSGSPLLDGAGKVIGLNTLVGFKHEGDAVQGLNYALESSYVYQQLRALKSGTDRDLTGWRSEHRCHRAMDMIAGVPFQHMDDKGMSMGGDSHGSGHDDGAMDKEGQRQAHVSSPGAADQATVRRTVRGGGAGNGGGRSSRRWQPASAATGRWSCPRGCPVLVVQRPVGLASLEVGGGDAVGGEHGASVSLRARAGHHPKGWQSRHPPLDVPRSSAKPPPPPPARPPRPPPRPHPPPPAPPPPQPRSRLREGAGLQLRRPTVPTTSRHNISASGGSTPPFSQSVSTGGYYDDCLPTR